MSKPPSREVPPHQPRAVPPERSSTPRPVSLVPPPPAPPHLLSPVTSPSALPAPMSSRSNATSTRTDSQSLWLEPALRATRPPPSALLLVPRSLDSRHQEASHLRRGILGRRHGHLFNKPIVYPV